MRLPVRSLVSLLSDWTKQASLNSYIVLSRPPSMDLLAKYGVNPGMPKTEFVHHLNVHSNVSLKKLREALFNQACEAELYPRECQGLPLVSRRDTAIRPAASVLCEDVWVIMHCVENSVLLPRTVFKNGKRSKSFVTDAKRPQSQSESSQSLNQPLPLSSDQLTLETLLQTTQTTTQTTMQTSPQPQSPSISQSSNQSLSQSSENQSSSVQPTRSTTQSTLETLIQSTTQPTTQSQFPSTNHQVLPSSSSFANSLICREINTIKDELYSVKAEIAMLDRKPTTTFS